MRSYEEKIRWPDDTETAGRTNRNTQKAEQFACAGAQQVILPSLDAVLHNGMSKAEEFAKQRHQLFGVIERNRYRCLTRSGNQLKDGEFAITQETLIAQNVPLSAYQL